MIWIILRGFLVLYIAFFSFVHLSYMLVVNLINNNVFWSCTVNLGWVIWHRLR